MAVLMPIHLSPRPIRAMRRRLDMPLFWLEETAKFVVGFAFFIGLGIVK